MKNLGGINVLGETVSVFMGKPEDDFGDVEMLESDCAFYVQEDNRICLNALRCGSSGQARANLLHEMFHAWFKISGARYYLRTQLPGFSTERLDEVEETLIRFLSPALDSSFDGIVKMFRLGRGAK